MHPQKIDKNNGCFKIHNWMSGFREPDIHIISINNNVWVSKYTQI